MKIANKDARRLWLAGQGLADNPTGPLDVMRIIVSLGFVQLDTIRNVTRAHHHILWSRNQNYREPMLGKLLKDERAIFEHFTHDASVLPMEFYPYWRRQFGRMEHATAKWFAKGVSEADIKHVRERVRTHGALCTKDFDTKVEGEKEMWSRPPHKKALDMLWYAGELTTCHRENFIKYYDLAERVVPAHHYQHEVADVAQINWLCRAAIDRLTFATQGEIQRFWDAVSAKEAKDWIAANEAELVPVELQAADGSWSAAFAHKDIDARLEAAPKATSRLRIINPFDPAIRERPRLKRLFGFEYVNEMFVPAKDRQWGYYVYPLLEGDRFVGRTEIKADRATGVMTVHKLWREPGVKWTDARANKFDAELARFARLAGIKQIEWLCARMPD